MIWEIGILLLYTGIVLSDFAHIGMLPYSGGIFMLVGVIAFDLSVNVIDRWRMNKIQQRALEAAKIEQKLQEARLELALHQIKPHFLQNALMSIKVLCRTRPKEAEQAVYDFAVFLRGNMNALESAEMILFREECKTIERYLHIEKMRFGERLQVQWDLQEEKFQIPPLTIQPLVENAVCHGICQKMEGGTVQIRSFRKNGEICVQILDDGAGFDTEKLKDADGIAIRNLKLRLKEFLNADLEIESRKGEGCRQTIHIPWEETEDEKYSDR